MRIFISFFIFFFVFSNKALSLNSVCPESLTTVEPSSFYSNEDKINLLCDLEDKVMSYHSGNLHEGFSGLASSLFQNCYDRVSEISGFPEDVNGLIMSCIAQFENGHLKSSLKNSPYLFLPFSITENSNGFFVRSKMVVAGCNDQSEIKLGDQVISINGTPVEDLVNELLVYQAGSSENARRSNAIFSFGSREYHFPENGQVEVLIKRNGQELLLSAFYSFYEQQVNLETKNRFISKNYNSCIAQGSSGTEMRGYYTSKPIYEADWEVRSTENVQTSPFASFSNVQINEEQDACYVNLNNFNSAEGYVNGSDEKEFFYEKLFSNITECNNEGKPLIVDFRFNEGGTYVYLNTFMNFLTPNHLSFLDNFRSLQFEHDLMSRWPCMAEVHSSANIPLSVDSPNAVFCQLFHSQSYLENGYENDILILTTPQCMSSCDIAVSVLGAFPNVTVIGTPTHGAFNGVSGKIQEFSNEQANSDSALLFQTDDRLVFLRVIDLQDDVPGAICTDFYNICYLPLESEPVLPDVFYEVGYDDIVSLPFGGGLRARINEILLNPDVNYGPIR